MPCWPLALMVAVVIDSAVEMDRVRQPQDRGRWSHPPCNHKRRDDHSTAASTTETTDTTSPISHPLEC